jgi:hypothetical protein
MPRVLVALDSQWGDARTNVSTYLQLYLNMDRRDNKADGVLNGPTTEAWFDHWYRHLLALGVRFIRGAARCLDPPAFDPSQPPHLRPRVQITLADGTQIAPDYTVVAVDAPGAEYITSALREAGTGGTVAKLDGFTTSAPPPDGPLQPRITRPSTRRDPYAMDQMGRVPWDRFQTLCGIQYYFDTEFQLLRGHMLLTGTEWALSSINQTGLWERRPVLDRDGHISVLSVDIADFNTPSSHLLDESGRGKAARDCTPDEIAAEVWRQIAHALTSQEDTIAEAILPWPVWYAIDRGLIMEAGPGQGEGRVARNETPYLVPIVGDWTNRPSSDPWNPHESSWTYLPSEDQWLEDLEQRNVWQARHGGYQVHNNSVVFAGTWNKTFTRVTSMESACESGRHAVNAILDHYVWVESGGLDRRENTTLGWEFPYGFLDQGLSSPVRFPTPAGDYCYIFDIENREPADTRALRILDGKYCLQSLPHPLDPPFAPTLGSSTSPITPFAGGTQMSTPVPDYNQMLAYLQIWRDVLEKATTAMATLAGSMPFTPPGMPGMPPIPPGTPMAPPAPVDYAQQLFTYLQAWRQYLEQSAGARPGASQSSTAGAYGGYPINDSGVPSPTHPHLVRTRPRDEYKGRRGDAESGGGAPTPTSESAAPTAPDSKGQSFNVPVSNFASKSEKWPPDPPPVVVEPRNPDGSQIPGATNAFLNARPEPSVRPVPPILEDLNQWVPPNFDYELGSPATNPAPPARRPSVEAPAPRSIGSPFLGAMGRVTSGALPLVEHKSLFKSPGQAPSL